MYFDETNNYFDLISNENELEIDKYVDKTKYNNFSFEVGNMVFNRHNSVATDPVNGFNRGNMFDDIYSKYKHHVYKLSVSNKKDDLLYKIQCLNFAIRDINLYLDLHPTEEKMISLFHKYNDELNVLKRRYDKEYNPLNVNEVSSNVKWTWINNPWPWDKGGNI